MPLIVWTDQMSVGVKLLDNDHKRLVLIVNQLHDGLMSGRAKPALEYAFNGLIQHVRAHHAQEEQILAEIGYHNSELHKQEHDQLVGEIMELQTQFINCEQLAEELELMRQLRGWFFKHIQNSDRDLVAHLRAHDVNAMLATRKTLGGRAWNLPANEPRMAQGVW
ncbi:MAG: bacteriohemerythrin [Terracidiphilus sp.]|jgi:hemerythrin